MKATLKKIATLVLAATLLGGLTLTLTSCPEDSPVDNPTGGGGSGTGGGGSTSSDPWTSLVNETSHTPVINGNQMKYGSHVYTMTGNLKHTEWGGDRASGTVTFTNIPSGYTEFSAVYQFLGTTPHGTAAMTMMAMEIYYRNKATGEKCIDLLVSSTKTRDMKNALSSNYKSYRYLAAAQLDGATPFNAYKPNEPYSITINGTSTENQFIHNPEGEVSFLVYRSKGYGYNSNNQLIDPFGKKMLIRTVLYDGETLGKINYAGDSYLKPFTIKGAWGGLK